MNSISIWRDNIEKWDPILFYYWVDLGIMLVTLVFRDKGLDVILPEDDYRRLYNDEVNLGVLEETLIEMKGGDLSNIPRPIVITVNGNGGISIVDAWKWN